MKKHLLALVGVTMAVAAQAQTVEMPNGPVKVADYNTGAAPSIKLPNRGIVNVNTAANGQRKRTVSAWYSFAEQFQQVSGQVLTATNFILFPDSIVNNIYIDPQNNNEPVVQENIWTAAGNVLDPTYEGFNNNTGDINDPSSIQLTKWNAYTVDSIRGYITYSRQIDSIYDEVLEKNVEVVDTLIIQYGVASAIYNFISDDPEENADKWSTAGFNRKTRLGSFPAAQTYRMPLYGADSVTDRWKAVTIPAKLNVPRGGKIIMMMTYKPGTKYQFGDTLFYAQGDDINIQPPVRKHNVLRTLAFNDNEKLTRDTASMNHGSYMRSNQIYRELLNNFGNQYLPGNYFVGFFQGSMEAFLTSTNVGVGVDNKIGYASSGIYPNPATGNAVLNYTIAASENVNVKIFDVLGKPVMNLNQGIKPAGEHAVSFDVSNLKAGVYFCTLTAGGYTRTAKFTVK